MLSAHTLSYSISCYDALPLQFFVVTTAIVIFVDLITCFATCSCSFVVLLCKVVYNNKCFFSSEGHLTKHVALFHAFSFSTIIFCLFSIIDYSVTNLNNMKDEFLFMMCSVPLFSICMLTSHFSRVHPTYLNNKYSLISYLQILKHKNKNHRKVQVPLL